MICRVLESFLLQTSWLPDVLIFGGSRYFGASLQSWGCRFPQDHLPKNQASSGAGPINVFNGSVGGSGFCHPGLPHSVSVSSSISLLSTASPLIIFLSLIRTLGLEPSCMGVIANAPNLHLWSKQSHILGSRADRYILGKGHLLTYSAQKGLKDRTHMRILGVWVWVLVW